MSFCTNCGSEISDSSKFCSNCGAKQEEAKKAPEDFFTDTTGSSSTDSWFSGGDAQPVYDKVEAEILNESKADDVFTSSGQGAYSGYTNTQSEINIQYDSDDAQGTYQSQDTYQSQSTYQSQPTGYYASSESIQVQGGNVGLSVASMVCGILSILCCCFTFFGFVLAVAAIVLGIICLKNNYEGKGMAIAGIICGGISVFLLILFAIIGGVTGIFAEAFEEYSLY